MGKPPPLNSRRSARSDEHGLYCYNLFSVSEADYRRLCEMRLAYFEELRDIVRRSQPEERVVVANLQVFALDGAPSRVDPAPQGATGLGKRAIKSPRFDR